MLIEMKPKYLLDECVSIHFPSKNEDFLNSINILGAGAKDDKILRYVKKTNMILISCDKKFSLNIACDQEPVIFIDRKDGQAYKLTAEKDPDLGKFYDPVTYYIQKTQNVIIA